MTARRAAPDPCPNQADHTPAPTGYLAWHEWAGQMATTHRQRRCPGCQRWAVWEPLDTTTRPEPPTERGCRPVPTKHLL